MKSKSWKGRIESAERGAAGLKAPDVIARAEGPGTRSHKSSRGLRGRNKPPATNRVPPLQGLAFWERNPGLHPGLSHGGLSALIYLGRFLSYHLRQNPRMKRYAPIGNFERHTTWCPLRAGVTPFSFPSARLVDSNHREDREESWALRTFSSAPATA